MRLPIILTCLCVTICLRIEWLNHRAGGYLPRTDYQTLGTHRWLSKWRVGTTHEPTLRRSYQIRKGLPVATEAINNIPSDNVGYKALTPAEEIKLRGQLERNRFWLSFYNAVAGPGLLQYLLVPITLFIINVKLTTPDVSPSHRRKGFACLAMVALCGILMLYRGYFTSLGW